MDKLRTLSHIYDGPPGPPNLSRDVGIEVAAAGEARTAGRRMIAVIGIDCYHKWKRLHNAVNDARGALDAFVRLGFEPAAEPLYDDAATAEAIRHLVADRLSALGSNDSLILFFAGHGHMADQPFEEGDSVRTGYLIPVDSDLPEGSTARWLRVDTWLSDLARLPVKHLLVFLDACYSGIALRSLIPWRGQRGTESFEHLGRVRSRKVITSAMEGQRAMDAGPLPGHSLFTGCLIEGLDGRIAARGALVTGSQIGLYLQQRVTSYPESPQTPQFGDFEQDRGGELLLSTEPVTKTTKPGAVAVEGPAARFRRSLAVIVGIDAYGDGISPLGSAVADARAIAEALHRDHGFKTWCVFDAAASLDHLLAVLRDELPAALGPDDRLVFYFAGHGVALGGDAPMGYLVPADARRAHRDGLLPLEVVYRELARLPVRHALVILDCCFSGLSRSPGVRDPGPAAAAMYLERYEQYLASAAWQVLISATTEPLVLDLLAGGRGEGADGHSPFARALLDGLGGAADAARSHVITAAGLARFVRDRVAAAGSQTAQLFALDRHGGGQFVFQAPDRVIELPSAPPLDEVANPYRGMPGIHESGSAGAGSAPPAMTRDQLRQIIEQPAVAAALRFEPPGLVERLLDDAAVIAGPLPVLSFALGELYRMCCTRWQAGDRDRALRETDYDAIGGVASAMAWRATALHDELVAEHPAYAVTIGNLFTRMVVAGGWTLAAGAVPLDELAYGDPAEDRRVAEVVTRFEAAGLIARVVERHDPGATRELLAPVRDELLRTWPCIRRWLDELDTPPGTRALLGALAAAVRAWRAHGQPDAELWDATRAVLAQRAARARPFALTVDEAAFVERSAAAAHRRRLALVERARAGRRSLARCYQETGRQLLLEGRAFEAVPYLVEARRAGASGAPLRMLFAAAARNLASVPLAHHGAVLSARFCGLGERIVTASRDGTVRIWSAATGEPLGPPLAHGDAVWCAAFSRDGARLVTASEDRAARIWDPATGRLIAPPLVHQAGVRSAAFSPDGSRVVTASDDHTAQLWDAAAGTRQHVALEHHGPVGTAVFSPGGTRILTASEDRTARVWDAATGLALCPPLRHKGTVFCAAFRPDGKRVVTASEDGTARIWDAVTGTPASPPLAHGAAVSSAGFSPDGTRVITASEDGTARIWLADTGAAVGAPLAHDAAISSAGFSPDGTRAVTASGDHTARVWDATTGAPLGPAFEHHGAVHAAGFSADGYRVVTASADGTARVWDATAGSLPFRLAHRGSVETAAFRSDGACVVTASVDGTARIWNAVTGEALAPPLAHRDRVLSAAFSPDGRCVVTTSSDRTAQIWDVATGMPRCAPLAHHEEVRSARFSPDGARVVTASSDQTARVWDAVTGQPVSPPLEHHSFVWSAGFSPDGARVVTASSDQTARVWDATTGRPLSPPLEHRAAVRSAVFSGDGARVVTASWDNTARVWDATTGRPLSPPLGHHNSVWCAAFDRDGTRVVTASLDRAARIWDAATGRLVVRPLAHRDNVWSAAFSPDGSRVVTASADHTARVWDALTGSPLCPPLEHRGEVRSAAFSPDGTRIVTVADDLAYVWTIPLAFGTLAAWAEVAQRGPYVLSSGVLSLRCVRVSDPGAASAHSLSGFGSVTLGRR